MAWALQFDGVNDYAEFATVNRSDSSWRIEFRAANNEVDPNISTRILGQTSSLNDYIGASWNNVQDMVIYRVDASNTSMVSAPDVTGDNDFHTYIIIDDGVDMTLQIDSGSIITAIGGGGKAWKDFNSFCRAAGSFYGYSIEFFRYYDTSTGDDLVHNWDATNSTHATGTPVLTDFGSAGNDATGINMPTDGSAWIDLGGGATTSNANIIINAPVFAAQSSVTLPQPISNAAITIQGPQFSVASSVTTPNFNSSVDVSIAGPVFSAQSSVTSPNPDSNIGFNLDKPVFSATVTVTDLTFNSTANINVEPPLFSAQAEVTQPAPISTINMSISGPIFSAMTSVTGLDIIVGSDAKLTVSYESNQIILPTKSNSIKV